MVKPMKTLELHYPMIQFLIMLVIYPPSSNIPHANPALNCLSNLPNSENTVSRLRTHHAPGNSHITLMFLGHVLIVNFSIAAYLASLKSASTF